MIGLGKEAFGKLHALTLGMGCFWGPEALFGHLPGVVRTRVGYAGGTSPEPEYRQMGDHSETVEVVFDPALIPLEQLLHVFWSNHKPVNINGYKGRQYMSLLFYRDEEQHEVMKRVKAELEEKAERFYQAEDRHQKYYLKRHPDAVDKLAELYPSHEELVNATITARLNGLAKGYVNMEGIRKEVEGWPVLPDERERLLQLLRRIKW